MIVEQSGARVYYEQAGSGHPALLLHGWGGKCESFLPVLRDFEGMLSMTALDFPGQNNRSSDPPEPWSVTEYMEMTADIMRSLNIERAHVVAHSFGGRVALVLAATYPELVGKMVLTGVPGLRPSEQAKPTARTRAYKALRSLADNAFTRGLLGEKNVDGMRNALQQQFGSADYKACSPEMRKTFVRVVNQDLTAYLARIRAPTLLFWGENDTAAPLWMGQKMEQLIPDAGLIVMPGADHFAYLNRYADFRAIIQNFLVEQEGPGPAAGGERR